MTLQRIVFLLILGYLKVSSGQTEEDTTVYDATSYFMNETETVILEKEQIQEANLVSMLLSGYNKLVRPIVSQDDVITVDFMLAPAQLVNMDEVNQVMKTLVWMSQKWYDAYLTWDPDQYWGIKSIPLRASDIWMPDIILHNNANDDFYGSILKTYATVHYDGLVEHKAPAILYSACELNPLYFPFDSQDCILTFSSWSYNGDQINLVTHADEADSSIYKPNGEWELTGIPLEREVVYNTAFDALFPQLTFHVLLKRLPLFYMYNLALPCIIIALLVLLAFYLPSEAGEKITMCITIMLSLTVFLLLVAQTLPPTSEVVPIISLFFMLMIFLVGFCSAASVIIKSAYHRGEQDSKPIPDWLRHLVLVKIAKALSAYSDIKDRSDGGQDGGEAQDYHQRSSPFQSNPAGGIINPVFEGDSETNHSAPSPDSKQAEAEASTSAAALPEESIIDVFMEKVSTNLQQVLNYATGQDEGDALATEWKQFAFVLDRFFKLIFFIFMVIFTIIMLVVDALYL